jgi:hypothetical protein
MTVTPSFKLLSNTAGGGFLLGATARPGEQPALLPKGFRQIGD